MRSSSGQVQDAVQPAEPGARLGLRTKRRALAALLCREWAGGRWVPI